MTNDIYIKYLKYKEKYLNLRNNIGKENNIIEKENNIMIGGGNDMIKQHIIYDIYPALESGSIYQLGYDELNSILEDPMIKEIFGIINKVDILSQYQNIIRLGDVIRKD